MTGSEPKRARALPIAAWNYPTAIAYHAGVVYFVNGGGAVMAVEEGCRPLELALGPEGAAAIALDDERVYWTSAEGVHAVPHARDVDARRVTTLAADQARPWGIAVDATHVYWACSESGLVQKAPKAGGAVTTLASLQPNPSHVAIDDEWLYFVARAGAHASLVRVPKTGGALESVPTPHGVPGCLVAHAGRLWWFLQDDRRIFFITRDGEPTQALVSREPVRALAVTDDHLFWLQDDSVVRATLAGELTRLGAVNDAARAIAAGGGRVLVPTARGGIYSVPIQGGSASEFALIDVTLDEVEPPTARAEKIAVTLAAPVCTGLAVADGDAYVGVLDPSGATGVVCRVPRLAAIPEVVPRARPYGLLAEARALYWIAESAIVKQPLGRAPDGATRIREDEPPQPLARVDSAPAQLLLDATHVYWIEGSTRSGSVMAVPKTGDAPTVMLASEPRWIVAFAVDDAWVYYTIYSLSGSPSNDGAVVKRLKVGGARVLLASEQPSPGEIALDRDHVYWVNRGPGRITRMRKEGGDAHVIATGIGKVSGFGVDDRYVYWLDAGVRGMPARAAAAGRLMAVPKQGGRAIVMADHQPDPSHLVVTDDALYWASRGAALRLAK